MTTAAHTKGPWTADWSKYREDTFIVQAGQPSNRVLASFDGDGDGPDDQSMADAHLIAAAPDMLTALKWAESALAPFSKAPAEKSGIAMIRKAIAKAEGRAS